MTHPQSERWSEYIDKELPAGEMRECEAHLAECPECRSLVDDLGRVVARAAALEDQPPRTDLWPRVSARIGLGPRRFAFSVPQLLAASIALMLISGGGVAYLMQGRSLATAAAVPQMTSQPVRMVSTSDGYDIAIGRLQQQLSLGRGALDHNTMRVIEEKLAVIDQAILDAERAVASDPGSEYLRSHLTRARLNKLDLLRTATELTRTVS
ncbi:MAG: hypothetical protein E4H38_02720 [Gemmatimonadales bacterium]|nr:MAG: hypothetical protein E4H38_02720 [Gemmatimonadales bacterium]